MARLLLPVVAAAVVAACSPGTAESNAATGPDNGWERAKIERPANSAASGLDDIMGAVPGPCGAEKAADYMGRTYSPEVAAELKAKTGARQIETVDTSGADADRPTDPHRLNVLLNSRGEIILLDCG